ncbi:hypothetical protein SteCoe_18429 [Stentor coeruleus]|uniref:Uncharacterized protein n=1 Tax=Stentor coeruleus TaxID=5963 RepID=A0A1R2BWT4_9CILI|nr:hypothetical protein SteCoe_18429 [Stentor coeruleus]
MKKCLMFDCADQVSFYCCCNGEKVFFCVNHIDLHSSEEGFHDIKAFRAKVNDPAMHIDWMVKKMNKLSELQDRISAEVKEFYKNVNNKVSEKLEMIENEKRDLISLIKDVISGKEIDFDQMETIVKEDYFEYLVKVNSEKLRLSEDNIDEFLSQAKVDIDHTLTVLKNPKSSLVEKENQVGNKFGIALEGHFESVRCVKVIPDKNLILSGSTDSTIRLFNIDTLSQERIFEFHSCSINSIDVSKTEPTALSGSSDCLIVYWNYNTGKILQALSGHKKSVTCVCFGLEETCALSGSEDGCIYAWDLKEGKILYEISATKSRINCLDFASFKISSVREIKDIFVWASQDGIIRVHNFNTSKLIFELKWHKKEVRSLLLWKKSQKLISGSEDKTIIIWDLITQTIINELSAHKSFVTSLALSPDEKYLYSASDDKTILSWSLNRFKPKNVYQVHSGLVWGLAVTKNNSHLVSCSEDKSIKIISLQEKNEKCIYNTQSQCKSILINQEKSIVALGFADGTLLILDLMQNKLLLNTKKHANSITALAFSENRACLISADCNLIALWDMSNYELYNSYQIVASLILSLALTEAQNRIIYIDNQGVFGIINLDRGFQEQSIKAFGYPLNIGIITKNMIFAAYSNAVIFCECSENGIKEQNSFKAHEKNILCLDLSQDEKLLATGSEDSSISIWNTEKWNVIYNNTKNKGSIFAVKLVPDSKFVIYVTSSKRLMIVNFISKMLEKEVKLKSFASLVLGATLRNAIFVSDKDVKICALRKRKERVIKASLYGIYCVAMSSNLDFILIGSQDGIIRKADTKSFEILNFLLGHTSPVIAISLNSKSTQAVSTAEDYIMILWDLKENIKAKVFSNQKFMITCLSFWVDKYIICGCSNGNVQMWKTYEESLPVMIGSHKLKVTCLEIFELLAISASEDESVMIWNLKNLSLVKVLEKPGMNISFRVCALAIDKKGENVFLGTSSGKIMCFSLLDYKFKCILEGHKEAVKSLVMSKANKHLLSSSNDKTIKMWNIDTRKLEYNYLTAPYKANCLRIADNESIILFGANNNVVKFINFQEEFINKISLFATITERSVLRRGKTLLNEETTEVPTLKIFAGRFEKIILSFDMKYVFTVEKPEFGSVVRVWDIMRPLDSVIVKSLSEFMKWKHRYGKEFTFVGDLCFDD